MIFSQVNEIANYALTILIYASDGDELTQINYIINSGIIAPLLSFLKSNVDETLTMALRVFNNLSYGADTQTRVNLN